MDENVIKDQIILEFVNLQRIKNATDRDAEINYQENVLKTKMFYMGISVDGLEMECKKQGEKN